MTASVDLSPNQFEAQANLQNIPLSLVDLFHEGAQVGGELSGNLILSGTGTSPTGKLNLHFTDVQQQTLAGRNLPKFMADLEVDWIDNKITLAAAISDHAQVNLDVNARFPMVLPPDSLIPSIPDSAQVSGQANGQFHLESFLRLLPMDEYNVSGAADMDIDISGSIMSPDIRGIVKLEQGVFESFATATLIKDIALTMEYQKEKISLTGSATDGQKGSIDIQGAINPSPETGFPFEVALNFSEMTFIGLDALTARASGNLNIGGIPERIKVGGELVTTLVEVYIVDSGDTGVVELDVTEINRSAGTVSNEIQRPSAGSGNSIELEINLTMPNRVFLIFSGLDSEWAGAFRFTGELPSPAITGELRPIRGGYTLLGKLFTLKTGSVRIDSTDELDPVINLPFEYTDSNFTAVLTVTGNASRPDLELTSRPSLPPSEIVSRVLFGEDATTLSAGQKLELAGAVAQLGGGGPGALDKARNKLGIDVLGFDEGQDDGTTTVKAGKYLAERVYLEVERGANEEDDATTIEYDLTPHVKVQTGSKGSRGSQVGIEWRRDY